MIHLFGLAAALTLLWLGLSGMMTPLFLVLGGFTILVTLWFSAQLDVIDRDGAPYMRTPQLLIYCAWIAVEVAKSNAKVMAVILGDGRGFNPGLVTLDSIATSKLGKTLFANSITLTPGTVTADIHRGRVVVHALDRPGSGPEAFIDMDRRSRLAADGRG